MVGRFFSRGEKSEDGSGISMSRMSGGGLSRPTDTVPYAPTPNNTVVSGADPTGSRFSYFSRPDQSYTTSGFGGDGRGVGGSGMDADAPSIRPSLTATGSAHHSSYSARSTSHLLPYTPPVREAGLQTVMPHSDKDIPAPLDIAPNPSPSEMPQWANIEANVKALTDEGDGNVDDRRLKQLGYDAVLGRDYTFWSSLAISWMNIGSIQGSIAAVRGAYNYGGPLMILVMWPLSGCWTIFLTLSLAELAAVYPVSGAMASWAWKVARGGVGWERWWAWLMGGSVLGGHVASALLVTWQLTEIIQGLMELALDYQRQKWQSVLFFLCILMVCGVVGAQSWGRSHRFWLCAGIYGVSVWLILCISLLATGARHAYSIQPHLFMNETGWENRPYVFLLGWSYCTIASGHDASAHMAEETQNPSRNVPNAMVSAMALTYITGMISIALLLLSIGPDDVAVIKAHNFPVGYILTTAINQHAAIGICTLLIFCLTIQILAQLQASSRFVFALARDNAMPFSETIARTNKHKQPIVAHWVVIALCLPFTALVVAGRGPLYSVLAVTASTLSYLGYTTPVLLYLLSGKDLQNEGRSSWSLRTKSKIIGSVGVVYGMTVIAVSMAPGTNPVNIRNISWSPVILVGTVIICLITWRCYGVKHYSGPIKAVTKWETGVEIDLQSAIASQRSRPSKSRSASTNPSNNGPSGPGDMDKGQVHHMNVVGGARVGGGGAEDEDKVEGEAHNVMVAPASAAYSYSYGTGSEWTDGTETGMGTETGNESRLGQWTDLSAIDSGQGAAATNTNSRSRGPLSRGETFGAGTMGDVAESPERGPSIERDHLGR